MLLAIPWLLNLFAIAAMARLLVLVVDEWVTCAFPSRCVSPHH
jgi:hypothetical protein